MTEYAGESDQELASAFITSTCQLVPRSSLVYTDHMHSLLASKDPVRKAYIILCGSRAEFYIRPLITCIDDKDLLVVSADELAFSGEFPVLPREFSGLLDRMKGYKIEPYDRYPGFVRLKFLGEMNYNWKFNKYDFNYIEKRNLYMTLDMGSMTGTYGPMTIQRMTLLKNISGPAFKQQTAACKCKHTTTLMGTDIVSSIWCPQWPEEAKGWLNRPRYNGWPTIDVISEVVQNGCHVVCVKHRSCRDDKLQWRFSFSLAEVTLLQSWTPTQQIVYHLLRFFAKTELIQRDCPKEDEVLCTYHLKTLMLWTCEEMSPKWWNSTCIFTICSELLNKCADWLQKKHCSNYFIPEANLFQDQPRSNILEKTVRQLHKFSNSGILCQWFVKNYILVFIRSHTQPVKNMPHFEDFLVTLFDHWKVTQLESLEFSFVDILTSFQDGIRSIVQQGLDSGFRQGLLTSNHHRGLESMEWTLNTRKRAIPVIQSVSCLTHLVNLVCILHAAYGLGCEEISWDGSLCVEAVIGISIQPKITKSVYHNFPKSCSAQSSRFQSLRVQDLMKNLTGLNSRSEFQLLTLMAKQFLIKILNHDDTISNGIDPVAFAYLAALHFTTSEYQEAKRLCSSVLMNRTSKTDRPTETLNAGCLLFIDDVAGIVGLCVLQRQITESNLHFINRKLCMDLRLSPDIFAHYLSGLSAERMFKRSDFYHDFPDSLYPLDVNFKGLIKQRCIFSMKLNSFYSTTRQVVYRMPDSLIETDASNVNHMIVKESVLGTLMEYALENMVSFYNVIRKDFGVSCNTADCYRALHLYNCRKYDEVLHLCERILQEPDLQKNLKTFGFANVLLLSPYDSFFDRDVQALLGFHTLFYWLSPLNGEMGEIELTDILTFEHSFAFYVHSDKSSLLSILKSVNLSKDHYFLGRHFIARYLKLRCCIDCSLPCTVSKTEFATQEINLPFEHIIRRFLLRKLRI